MTAFGELVAQMVGLDGSFTSSTVLRWEEGAEPGLVAGCAIAALGDVSPDTLAFQDVVAPSGQQTAPYVLTDEEEAEPATRPPEAGAVRKRRPKAG